MTRCIVLQFIDPNLAEAHGKSGKVLKVLTGIDIEPLMT